MNNNTTKNYRYQLSIIDLVNQEQLIFLIEIFHVRYISPFNTTITKRDHIGKTYDLKYNCQSLSPACEKIRATNGRLFISNMRVK